MSSEPQMNHYCKHKVLQFHEAFLRRSFDQDDVALLITSVRDFTQKGSIFRELGDFLAHPIAKERGIVLDRVEAAAADFETNHLRYFTDAHSQPPVFRGLGTADELIGDLMTVFRLAGLEGQVIRSDDLCFRDFVFCVIFLLGSFRLMVGNRLFEMAVCYSHGLTLTLTYECLWPPRRTVVLPVLTLPNVWVNCPVVLVAEKHVLSQHIARRFQEGHLAAIPYEDDKVGRQFSIESFDQRKAWPLPDLA